MALLHDNNKIDITKAGITTQVMLSALAFELSFVFCKLFYFLV